MHVVIIGNGIAGITTARHIRKRDSNCKITVISSESKHFFSRTALMYVYMGHMKFEHTKPYEDWFWEKNRIDLLQAHVSSIDFNSKQLTYDSEGSINYDKLVIATGSKPNKFGWKGENLEGVQGLYSKQDLELLEKNTKDIKSAVIVGGGLIGVELAEMLHSRKIKVTILVREDRFWGNVLPKEEAQLIQKHLIEQGIEVLLNTELDEITEDGQAKVAGIRTTKGDSMECQFVGLTVGLSPNVDFLKNTSLEIDRGVLVNEYLETNLSGVYAIGDCAQLKVVQEGRRAIEQVWYTGRMMGECLAATICGEKKIYKPGPWFNSAKFFDLEYQNYGSVGSELRASESAFYWESDSAQQAIKLIFETETQRLIGLNSIGIRLRHELMDKYLKQEMNLHYFMEHLSDLNFEAEFAGQWLPKLQEKYSDTFGKKLHSKKKSWMRILKNN